MRRIVFTALCALALIAWHAPFAAAQSIGFKVGPTFSTVDTDPDDDDLESLTSFGGGGFVRFGLGGLSVQLELLAVTKGFQEQHAGHEDKLKVTYIEVPLTAMFSLGNGPYFFAGPSFAFKASCELEEAGTNTDCADDTVKSTDFGVAGGAGLQFRLGPGSVLVEGRYTWGLTDISETAAFKMRNRSAAVFAGYAIPIGR